MFPGKSTILRKSKELEKYADSYLPYKYYMSSTGHINVKFKYVFVCCVLFALGLLETAKIRDVKLSFTLDVAEVYKTTKKCHVLACFKIFDCGTKFPGTNKLIFQ